MSPLKWGGGDCYIPTSRSRKQFITYLSRMFYKPVKEQHPFPLLQKVKIKILFFQGMLKVLYVYIFTLLQLLVHVARGVRRSASERFIPILSLVSKLVNLAPHLQPLIPSPPSQHLPLPPSAMNNADRLSTNVYSPSSAIPYCTNNGIDIPSDLYYAWRNARHFAPNTRLNRQIRVSSPIQLRAEALTSDGPRIEYLLSLHVPAYRQFLKCLDAPSRVMVTEAIRRLPALSLLADIFGRGEGDSSVGWYTRGMELSFTFAFHRLEANGLQGFKAKLEDANMMGGFSAPRPTSDNGQGMKLAGWRAGVLSLITVAFGLSVYKRSQHKLIAEALCSALIGISCYSGASLRHQSLDQLYQDRAELDRLMKVEKHQENRRSQQ